MNGIWKVAFDIPLVKPLPSAANLREHWRVRAARVKTQRAWTATYLRVNAFAFNRAWEVLRGNERFRLVCCLTRIAPRPLDSDNLEHAFKGVRDEVAHFFKLDDGSDRWAWHYRQRKGKPAVHIEVRIADAQGCECVPNPFQCSSSCECAGCGCWLMRRPEV